MCNFLHFTIAIRFSSRTDQISQEDAITTSSTCLPTSLASTVLLMHNLLLPLTSYSILIIATVMSFCIYFVLYSS